MAVWLHVTGAYVNLDHVEKVNPVNVSGTYYVQFQGDFGTVNGNSGYSSQADALAAIPALITQASNVTET